MAVSKFKHLAQWLISTIFIMFMGTTVVAEEGPCRWSNLRTPAYELCLKPRSASLQLQCRFLEVLGEELCQSELKDSPRFAFSVHHIDGFAGGVISFTIGTPGRNDTLQRTVYWRLYPTEDDFRKDARTLIGMIVQWLNRCPAKPPRFLDA